MLRPMIGGTSAERTEEWRPRGPHLPVAMPPLAWVFGLVAVWFVITSVRQFMLQTPYAWPSEWGFAGLPWLADAATLLLPVAFLWRHPDARRTMPYLYAGVLLYGAGPLIAGAMSALGATMSEWLMAASVEIITWPMQAGSSVVAGAQVMALLLIGLGLHWSREAGPTVTRRAVAALLVLAALLGLVQLAEMVGALRLSALQDASTQILIMSIVSYQVRLLALGLLALVLVRGWREGLTPARGWGLAAIGLVLIAVTQALVPLWYLLGSLGIDVFWLGGPVAWTVAAGGVLLLAGFAAGLPRARPEPTAAPVAATQPGSGGS